MIPIQRNDDISCRLRKPALIRAAIAPAEFRDHMGTHLPSNGRRAVRRSIINDDDFIDERRDFTKDFLNALLFVEAWDYHGDPEVLIHCYRPSLLEPVSEHPAPFDGH